MHRPLRAFLLLLLLGLLNACGGGGGGSSSTGVVVTGTPIQGSNVLPVVVDAGLSTIANRLYASVTLCAPGSSSNCVTVDNMLVDTGSVGLRLISTTALSNLGLAPPNGFSSLENCVHFLDNSSAWGSVKVADVKLGNMVAPNVPLQLINDPSVTATSPCSGTAIQTNVSNNSHALNANGILGIGMYTEDCGSTCASGTNGTYYTCTSNSCTGTRVATSAQLQNPIPHFASDNNGLVVVLPSVSGAGAVSVSGSILFGIGTQSNNQLGNSTLLQTSLANSYNINTSVTAANPSNGANISGLGNMNGSFLDTGSNSLYFGTAVMSTTCSRSTGSFYCPPSGAPVTFSAVLSGSNGLPANVSYVASNSDDQFNGPNFALPQLTGNGSNSSFDWGLPFFFGRSVFIGIDGMSANTGVGNATVTGPYYAF